MKLFKQLEWWEPSASNNWTYGAPTIIGTFYIGICGGRHTAWYEESNSEKWQLWEGPVRGSLIEAQADAERQYQLMMAQSIDIESLIGIWPSTQSDARLCYVDCQRPAGECRCRNTVFATEGIFL